MPIMPFAQNYNLFQNSPRLNPNARPQTMEQPNPFMRPVLPTPMPTPPIRQEPQEGPITSRYRQFLETEPPTRENYKPKVLERIGAALSSIGSGGGYAGTRDILDRKYQRALLERQLRSKELSEGAQLEYRGNNDLYNRNLEERKLTNAEKNTDSLVENRKSLEKRREALSSVAEYKAKNPGHRFIPIAGGNIFAFDPQNPNTPIDTGINAGTLNEEDKIGLNQQNTLERIAAQGGENRSLENTRQGGRVEMEGLRQENREKILQFKKENPTYRIVATRGGNFVAVNPSDPGDIVDTGVATGTLTDADKAELGLGVTTTSTTRVSETDKDGNPSAITRETTRSRSSGNKPNRNGNTAAKPAQMTSPDGKVYPTTGWTDKDFEEAKKRGWK